MSKLREILFEMLFFLIYYVLSSWFSWNPWESLSLIENHTALQDEGQNFEGTFEESLNLVWNTNLQVWNLALNIEKPGIFESGTADIRHSKTFTCIFNIQDEIILSNPINFFHLIKLLVVISDSLSRVEVWRWIFVRNALKCGGK